MKTIDKNDYTIRDATVWDAEKITHLWEKEMNEIDLDFMIVDLIEKEKFFISLLVKTKRNDYKILVAEINNNIIGFTMGHITTNEYASKNLILHCLHIYIEPKYRGINIFKDMLKQGADWGKSLGVTEFEFAAKYNKRLIKFYGKMGFKPIQIIYGKEV